MFTIARLILVVACFAFSIRGLADPPQDQNQKFASFSSCKLINGQSIAPCRIAYQTFGKLNQKKSNAVLVPTWFTGTSAEHAYLATSELIDPEQYFVVIVDALGNGVSSSPSNSKHQANEQFPAITITDMVNSQNKLLTEELEISSLHSIVGLSMGGMQAFEWAVRYPDFAQKTIAVIGTPRTPAFDIALWASRNSLLALYRECECQEALEAMAAMRMTQQVPKKLGQEIDRNETLSTITARANDARKSMSVAKTWDQLRQAEAMMSHNIARDFEDDMKKAAEHVESEFLIIVGADDRVVTPQPAKDFAALINAQLVVLDEDCGHGEPWCAADEFSTLIRGFLSKPRAANAMTNRNSH